MEEERAKFPTNIDAGINEAKIFESGANSGSKEIRRERKLAVVGV